MTVAFHMSPERMERYVPWLNVNDMYNRIEYEWPTHTLSFINDEDAVAFILAFVDTMECLL
ncbi:MAG TPA: hypothetical protein VIY47_02015 [Ignavibacteriaceae bacterium]